MTSEECRLLIPEYLSGQLTPAEKNLFEAQLETSAELRMEVEELRAVWDGLELLPEEQPSAELRASFYQKLTEVNNARRQSFRGDFTWWKPGLSGLVRQAAIAIILFGLGMYAGRANRETNREGHTQAQDMAEMHAQVQ
ncbi:MAG: zf-HC2 domain-containing protein, partial [Bryobacteraceae bacterium]